MAAVSERVQDGMNQWASAMGIYASTWQQADTTHQDGIFRFWADSPFKLWNGLMLGGTIDNQETLLSRLADAKHYMRQKSQSGWLYLCPDHLSHLDVEAATAKSGFVKKFSLVGMELTELPPISRNLTIGIDIARVTHQKAADDFAAVVAEVFKTEIAICRAEFTHRGFWREAAFAYIAYVDEEPVSVSSIIRSHNVLYVGLVCTRESFRNRGFSHALNHHALADACGKSGLKRAFLHATQLGFPVYKKLGFEPVMDLVAYSLSL